MRDGFQLDDPDDNCDDHDPGAYLRISRDATPDDLAEFMPAKTTEERAAWLDEIRSGENTVTLAVTTTVPVSAVRAFGETVTVQEITGLIIGPPGSEQFLRRPVDPEVALSDVQAIDRLRDAGRTALASVAEHAAAVEASGMIGAHEIAAATLITKYGTLDDQALTAAGADDQEIGAARSLLPFGPLDPGRVYEIAGSHVPQQVYGARPEKLVFGLALGQLDQRRQAR